MFEVTSFVYQIASCHVKILAQLLWSRLASELAAQAQTICSALFFFSNTGKNLFITYFFRSWSVELGTWRKLSVDNYGRYEFLVWLRGVRASYDRSIKWDYRTCSQFVPYARPFWQFYNRAGIPVSVWVKNAKKRIIVFLRISVCGRKMSFRRVSHPKHNLFSNFDKPFAVRPWLQRS